MEDPSCVSCYCTEKNRTVFHTYWEKRCGGFSTKLASDFALNFANLCGCDDENCSDSCSLYCIELVALLGRNKYRSLLAISCARWTSSSCVIPPATRRSEQSPEKSLIDSIGPNDKILLFGAGMKKESTFWFLVKLKFGAGSLSKQTRWNRRRPIGDEEKPSAAPNDIIRTVGPKCTIKAT